MGWDSTVRILLLNSPAVSLNNLNFILAGLNIERAPVEVLECVAVPTRSLKEHLERLAQYAGGGIILSTCNRTEIYSVADDPEIGVRQLREFIDAVPEHAGVDSIGDYIYTLTGDDVAKHLFSVTAAQGDRRRDPAKV